jgi:hypothetical protein
MDRQEELAHIEVDGGPSANTMRNWFKGKTKRPQNCTIEAAGRALGMKRVGDQQRQRRQEAMIDLEESDKPNGSMMH